MHMHSKMSLSKAMRQVLGSAEHTLDCTKLDALNEHGPTGLRDGCTAEKALKLLT